MTTDMPLREIEKIDSSIVVLSGVEQNITLDVAELSKIIREPTGRAIGDPPVQVEITSVRDQLVIVIAGDKFVFSDKSDVEPLSDKLPSLVHNYLALLLKQGVDKFRAYGVNYTIAFDSRGDQTAAELLAERFVKKEAISTRGSIDVGGAGLRFYFGHSGARCDMQIEPRGGKVDAPRIFAKINYHFELPDQQIPPLDDLRVAYQGLYPVFVTLLERLCY